MGDYFEYEQGKKEKQKPAMPKRRRVVILLTGVVIVLVLAGVVLQMFKQPAAPLAEDEVQDTLTASGQTARPSAEALPDGSWNVPEEVPTEHAAMLAPDYRMLALPENGRVDMSYFDTATFVGDSLTQGLRDYSVGIPNASYCAYQSISPRAIYDGSLWPPRRGATPEVPMDTLVASAPDNVYILLGANALSGNTTGDALIEYYSIMLGEIKARLLPEVKIYIQALTPVRPGAKYSMELVHSVNNRLAQLATENDAYFVDLTEPLAGDDGYLREEYASKLDGIHLTPAGYEAWVQYLVTHTAYHPRNPYI